jgi:hypothetical protein
MKKLFLWFKGALEGNDGKASHQKILTVYMAGLFTFIVISVGAFNFYYPESIYHIIAGVMLGQSAIRAWQSVNDHKIEKENEK